MREAGLGAALIDLGGELRGIGLHPAGRPWQVAVEDPRGGGAAGVLGLSDIAVATSGLLSQSYRIGAQEYRRGPQLQRLLGYGQLPRSGAALMKLMEMEADLEDRRVAGDAGYSISRHVEVLCAMMGEARILRDSATV